MEENPQHNVGRSHPASELDFVPVPRELVLATSVAQKRPPWSLGHMYGENRTSAVESRPETVSDVEKPGGSRNNRSDIR